jgi:hypothetical protein
VTLPAAARSTGPPPKYLVKTNRLPAALSTSAVTEMAAAPAAERPALAGGGGTSEGVAVEALVGLGEPVRVPEAEGMALLQVGPV